MYISFVFVLSLLCA